MGLLDQVLGAALNSQLGGQQQQQGGMGGLGGAILGSLLSGGNQQQGASILSTIINQMGGIQGIVARLTQAGLGQQANSWVGTGQNMPVSGTELESALGSDLIGNLAQQVGIDPSQASGMLAQVLPHLVNQMTPQGQIPQGGAANGQLDAGELIGMLGGMLGNR